MATIYLFRGISATGKTTITNTLSGKYNLPVFRKDDIYDSIQKSLTHGEKTRISYDALASIIQTNINAGINVIVDIALPHKPYIKEFLLKLDLYGHELYSFMCVCSDKEVWLNRWKERLKNPAPNQLFIDVDKIEDYYSKFDCTILEKEMVIDSVENVEHAIAATECFFQNLTWQC